MSNLRIVDTPVSLPMPPDDLDERVEWYAANIDAIKSIKGTLWHLERWLKDRVKETGPIVSPAGRITVESDGWEWDSAKVMEVAPALITGAQATITGKAADVYAAAELVEEHRPGLAVVVVGEVNKREAAALIKLKGEIGVALEGCREGKSKLKVEA